VKDVICGWWHGGDVLSAVETLNSDFGPLGAARVDQVELRAAMSGLPPAVDDEDEDHLRRHQIGWMARRANAALTAAGRVERVRAFAIDDSTDEEAWYLVSPEEYDAVRAERGAPEYIEKLWDDERVADPITAIAREPIRAVRIGHKNAEQVALDAYRDRNYELAARAARVWVDSGNELIGPLCLLESLVALGEKDRGKPQWQKTAARWLQGFSYVIYRHQWDRLLRLHAQLELPEDELVVRCRASRELAPTL
jgi:hypothetical protein